MSNRNRDTSTVAIVAGALVIAFGVWLLIRGSVIFLPGFITTAIATLSRLVGPIALIALGVLVIVAANRGAFRNREVTGRWYRSRDDRMVGGVLGGLGQWLGIDATLLRLGYVLLALVTGFWAAGIAYIVMMVVVPEEPIAEAPPVATSAPAPTPTPRAPATAPAPAPPASPPAPDAPPAAPPAPAAPSAAAPSPAAGDAPPPPPASPSSFDAPPAPPADPPASPES